MSILGNDPTKCPPRSSFYASIYSEIEEVGWDHLVRSAEDLSCLTFRICDKNGKAHHMELLLPKDYPEQAPSISADVPYLCKLQWSNASKLKDAVDQFTKHVEKLQDFWSVMDEIDHALPVLEPKKSSLATSFRQISLGNDCHLLVSVSPYRPHSLPECRFLGPNIVVNSLRQLWKKNSNKWSNNRSISENLEALLEVSVAKVPDSSKKGDEEIECGICYARYLPVDDELGHESGSLPDYTCENCSCSRAFHSVCLRDWLKSITTTRQSFDVLFGNCPYCSDPVAVKVNCSE